MSDRLELRNGTQTATFAPAGGGYRPEWMREAGRPMLRFKDHEWLNVGGVRVVEGALRGRADSHLDFGGTVDFGGAAVDWSVRVARPADGGPGFTVTTALVPRHEPVEVLEALTAFELPYEYDGGEESMVVMCQQPVYRSKAGKEISGAGWVHPFWYYGHAGRAHLTYPSASPMMIHRVAAADGSNERCTMLLGHWDVCSIKDMFAQPTRKVREGEEMPFADPRLNVAPGRQGMKYLIGAVNWNNSLYKDPNVLVEPRTGLHQKVTVDFAPSLPGGRWDAWIASGWERLARAHFPKDGKVPAFDVARSRGASWVGAARWLGEQFQKEQGYPGLFSPERGVHVYAPGTRPKWDNGVALFAGQWTGPLAYLGTVWDDAGLLAAADRLEACFLRDQGSHRAEHIWTVGPTPMYAAVMRKARLVGVRPETLGTIEDYVKRRAEYVLNPPPQARRGDPGILAWDAFSNLLAADLFDRAGREAAARELLARVNAKLDAEFWTFNCAAEGDLVGAGQSRPFGHAIAATANVIAWRRFGEAAYLDAAQRFANLLLGMHYITFNESPAPDLDTRGWAHGSTGGRDQWAQIPPWETGYSLQQLGQLMLAGKGRPGFYDVLWLHAHTGLAQFPAARVVKRLYRPDMSITYRPIDELPTERAFYLRLPYMAYENPWDQTMLAGYQGVEPIILSLFLGGGLVEAEDDRVGVFVPEAAAFVPDVARTFTAHLWNPTDRPVETRLRVRLAEIRRRVVAYSGALSGEAWPDEPMTDPLTVPPREAVRVAFEVMDRPAAAAEDLP